MSQLEVELEEELLSVLVPVGPELVVPFVDLSAGNLKRYRLVRLCCH